MTTSKAWKLANPEKYKAQAARYREKHQDVLAIYQMLLYWSDRENRIAKQVKWMREHKEQVNAYRRKYYAENEEYRNRSRAYSKRYVAEHPGLRQRYFQKNKKHHMEVCMRWQRNNPERAKEIDKRYADKHRDVLLIYGQLYRLSKKI